MTPRGASGRWRRWACVGSALAILAGTLITTTSGAGAVDLPAVTSRTISIQDPQVGPLTFPALAAGDPSLAAKGRLVLLLHGFPESGESFRSELPAIAAAGYYAVAPFQRGYSATARTTSVTSYNLLNLVSDAVNMANALGATTFHLVGHDWGGAVAWLTAELFPQRVSTLTVLSTPHPDALADAVADSSSGQKGMLSYLNLVTIPGLQNVLLAAGQGGLALGLKVGGLPASYANLYAANLNTTDALGAALKWYRANPVPSPLKLGVVAVPTLYIWGAKDPFFSQTAALDTAHYVSAPYRFLEITDGTHWLPETQSSVVTVAILAELAAAG
ncbi:Pimeloyl-ACP methyl ester carboxylesterase [Frankineae bacterium MT45]|nr:Pimeloyl-ACP methyl ester carboxylesterase [Frankineae bacterium MT45]